MTEKWAKIRKEVYHSSFVDFLAQRQSDSTRTAHNIEARDLQSWHGSRHLGLSIPKKLGIVVSAGKQVGYRCIVIIMRKFQPHVKVIFTFFLQGCFTCDVDEHKNDVFELRIEAILSIDGWMILAVGNAIEAIAKNIPEKFRREFFRHIFRYCLKVVSMTARIIYTQNKAVSVPELELN